MSGSTLLDGDDPALFSKLTDEQLELLAWHEKVRPMQVSEVLFRKGDATYDVMAVLEGRVAVVIGSGDGSAGSVLISSASRCDDHATTALARRQFDAVRPFEAKASSRPRRGESKRQIARSGSWWLTAGKGAAR